MPFCADWAWRGRRAHAVFDHAYSLVSRLARASSSETPGRFAKNVSSSETKKHIRPPHLWYGTWPAETLLYQRRSVPPYRALAAAMSRTCPASERRPVGTPCFLSGGFRIRTSLLRSSRDGQRSLIVSCNCVGALPRLLLRKEYGRLWDSAFPAYISCRRWRNVTRRLKYFRSRGNDSRIL